MQIYKSLQSKKLQNNAQIRDFVRVAPRYQLALLNSFIRVGKKRKLNETARGRITFSDYSTSLMGTLD
jgi:hypothetical protein